MSLTLLTDLYQLTMGAGYWKAGLAERQACFTLHYRRNPFGGGYAIAAGLEDALRYLESLSFGEEELAYLGSLEAGDGSKLFEPGFLEYLGQMRFSLDAHALPEGTLAFPLSPLIRIRGPLLQAQLVETALLNLVNFQTLIATKAARICRSARGPKGEQEAVLEFGLRRAQGIDGALSASRAAYVGGCAATSNVLAGQRYGIPVRGTHAHSWVMTFGDELTAFRAYADAFPKGSVFLVDTYDTLQGIRYAVEVGKEMRAAGHEMVGVRLDSGDLAQLSIDGRKILDEGGFPDATIVASNDLDEYRIAALKEKGATITLWGVGTRLATAFDQPALGGVYKLAAIQDEAGEWQPRIKLSDTPIKNSIPGFQQLRRFHHEGTWVADAIYDELRGFEGSELTHAERDETFVLPEGVTHEDLLIPVLEDGQRVYESPPLGAIRERTLAQLDAAPEGVVRNVEPAPYFAGIESQLAAVRARLIAARKDQ